MKLFKWIDTTSTEKQTCDHRWTECVTLEPTNEFMCIECGKKVELERGYCQNGKLYIKVEGFECYELACLWETKGLSKSKIKNTDVFVLNETYYHIERMWGPTTAFRFRNEMNSVLGFKIDKEHYEN